MGLEPTTTGITNARAALNPNQIKMLSNRFLMLCPNQKDKPENYSTFSRENYYLNRSIGGVSIKFFKTYT